LTTTARRFGVPLLLVVAMWLGGASPAFAHNELAGSEPAAGAQLDRAPGQISLRFLNPAPLNTATVEVIDANGTRTKITSLAHGASGDRDIVAVLPTLTAGAVTVRWRLVGPDGHPVSGRVAFAIVTGAGGEQSATGPAADFDDPWRVPSVVRWAIRWASYVALVILAGILGVCAWVAPSIATNPRLRGALSGAVVAIGVLGALQLLMLAGDIGGVSPLTAWSSVGTALGTSAGAAFGVRVLAALVLGWLVRSRPLSDLARSPMTAVAAVALLGSWAFAGHAASVRWSLVGVPLDIAHTAAAAMWLGGLIVVARIVFDERDVQTVAATVVRFSRVAPVAVAVLVGTGIVQSLRLSGIPDLSLGSTHTRLLIVKILFVAVMLKVADVNRGRVRRRFHDATRVTPRVREAVRRAMILEFVIGLAVIGLTAALVVSSPPVLDGLAIGGPASQTAIGGPIVQGV
jgi:copper transport protein